MKCFPWTSEEVTSNSGTSCAKNLAMLTSMSARSSSTLSTSSGYLSFKLPAAVSTDFTARMP